MAVAAAGLFAWAKHRHRLAATVTCMFSAGWLGGALAGRFLFPLSLRGFWALGLLVAGGGFICAWLLIRSQTRKLGPFILATLPCLFAGAFSVWAQLPPTASTRPLEIAVPKPKSMFARVKFATIGLSGGSHYDPRKAELIWQQDNVQIRCAPRLRFDRISPDKFWALLAPLHRATQGLISLAVNKAGEYRFSYSDHSTVTIAPDSTDGSIQCTSWSTIATDTYTHLNSYSVLRVEGHQSLALGFSPCPDARIDVLPADYPTGRPARFAYLSAEAEFKVVEATSGEKGPFHALATGPLRRGEPLSIFFYDNGQLLATITLEDWTQQLSTELSPTAGWGVPQNAIEFQRSGNSQEASIAIHITLAATSVGRGYETVGHRVGTYRNRLTFHPEPQ